MSEKAAMGSGKDELDRTGPVGRSPSPNTRETLPMTEPRAGAVEQLASLQQSLAELEATFRYMGKGHPQYESTRARLEQLRGMLERAQKG